MAKKLNVQSPGQANMVAFGQLGIRRLTSAAISVSGEYFAVLQAMEDTVLDLDIDCELGDSSLSTFTLPAGYYLHGRFHNVDITSGSLIGYLIEKQ